MKTNLSQTSRCRLALQGHFPQETSPWADWLQDADITSTAGRTVITGALEDQSALYGLLSFVRDLGLPIVSIELISDSRKENLMKTNLVNTIFKAVAVSMGIAVTVLSILGTLPAATAALLLGLGLACLSIASLDKKAV
jgi:hypothetical protein